MPERILIVDDNSADRAVLERSIAGLGYTPEATASGEEALRALQIGQFAAVLLDCRMPGMDGYRTASEICRRERHPAIIAMASDEWESDPARCRAAGMDDTLRKPVGLTALASALERWAGAPATPPPASTRLRDR